MSRLICRVSRFCICLAVACATSPSSPIPRVRPEHWLLSYDGTYKRGAADENFYVRAFAGVPEAECATGLFTGVIFLGVQNAQAGRWFAPWANRDTPSRDATLEDWFAYVDTLVAANGPLTRLDRAVARVRGRTVDIAVMVPAPQM